MSSNPQISSGVQYSLLQVAGGVALNFAAPLLPPSISGTANVIGIGLLFNGGLGIAQELKIVDAAKSKAKRFWKAISTPRSGSSVIGAVSAIGIGSLLGYYAPDVLKENLVTNRETSAVIGAVASWMLKSSYDFISGTTIESKQLAATQSAAIPAQPLRPASQYHGRVLLGEFAARGWRAVATLQDESGTWTQLHCPNQEIAAQFQRMYPALRVEGASHDDCINFFLSELNELLISERPQRGRHIPPVNDLDSRQSVRPGQFSGGGWAQAAHRQGGRGIPLPAQRR